jgi:excinuclease ABC subunit C
MRDDKSFPYILVTGDHEAPASSSTAARERARADYFGPFASAGAVGRTINALQRAFLLRTCTDSVYESRTRPCLLYQIKRCAGACTGEIDAEGYARLVGEAKAFLSGRSQAVKAQLAKRCRKASEDLDFERAAVYRDRMSALSHVQSHQGINPQTVEEADVFAIHHGGHGLHPGVLLPHRAELGQPRLFPQGRPVAGARRDPWRLHRPVLRRQADAADDPDLDDFEDRTLLAEALSAHGSQDIEISVPQRGEKRELVEQVLTNAREALAATGRNGLAGAAAARGWPRPST